MMLFLRYFGDHCNHHQDNLLPCQYKKENHINHCLIKKLQLIALFLSIQNGLEILNMKRLGNSSVQILRVSPFDNFKVLKVDFYPIFLALFIDGGFFVPVPMFINSPTMPNVRFPNIRNYRAPLRSVGVNQVCLMFNVYLVLNREKRPQLSSFVYKPRFDVLWKDSL